MLRSKLSREQSPLQQILLRRLHWYLGGAKFETLLGHPLSYDRGLRFSGMLRGVRCPETSVKSSRSSWIVWPLKMRPIGCSATSVTNYQPKPRNIFALSVACYFVWCVIVLYCIVLYCIVLYCIVLYCRILYSIVLPYTVLYCPVLHCCSLPPDINSFVINNNNNNNNRDCLACTAAKALSLGYSEVFCGVCYYFQPIAATRSQIRPQSLPSMSIPLHLPLTILSSHLTYSELPTFCQIK